MRHAGGARMTAPIQPSVQFTDGVELNYGRQVSVGVQPVLPPEDEDEEWQQKEGR